MSSNIKLVNWGGIAPSNFTWAADLRDIVTGVPFKIMEVALPMDGTWTVTLVPGDGGYSSEIVCLMNVRIYNTWNVEVWNSGLVQVHFQNNKSYEFDCVYKQMLEVTAGYSASIYSKVLTYDSTLESIPVSTQLQIGQQGYLNVVVQNTSPVSTYLYMQLTVQRPDGSIAKSINVQSTNVQSGGYFAFTGYTPFTFDMAGLWTISINILVWNGSSWVQADQWSGNLCTVQAAQPSFTNLQVSYDVV